MLFETKLSRADLAHIAERIASDVPFFVYGGAAVIRGRGECVEPIHPREDFGVLIIKPSWDSKTPEAYAELDTLRQQGLLRELPIERCFGELRCVSKTTATLVAEYENPPDTWTFQNDFEQVLWNKHHEYASLYEMMHRCGANFISMSGSGSCYYGIFPSRDSAVIAAKNIEKLLKTGANSALIPTMGIFASQPLARSIKVSYIQDCSEDTRSDKERPCYGSD